MTKYNVTVASNKHVVQVEADSEEDAVNSVLEPSFVVDVSLTEEEVDNLYQEVVSRLDDTYELVSVSYDDQLTDKQVSFVMNNDLESLDESLDEWESDSRWYGSQYVLDNVLSAGERDICFRRAQ